MDQICVAIRSNGIRCEAGRRRLLGDGLRCGTHHNSILNFGPNTYARRELGYVNKKEMDDFVMLHLTELRAAVARGDNNDTIWIREENYRADIRVMRARHSRASTDLIILQRNQVRATGVDPDAPAEERRRLRANARRQVRLANRVPHLDNAPEPVPAPIPPPRPAARRLAALAADPQNVHTTEAVNQTKQIVELIRKVPVPEGYRWNREIVSKTIGEIIAECQLTAHAAAQMFNQYVSTVSVYDIEEGIYGKVLDSVWQYVKASPDKEDLCKILKNEMTDNIGMCAQGNLSRICNILAGYMDGVGPQESLSERLGRLFPALMEIADITDRIHRACAILAENKVPVHEWDTWMEPLLEDEYKDLYELIRDELFVS